MTDRGKYMDALAGLEGLFRASKALAESEWLEVGAQLEKLAAEANRRSLPGHPQPRMAATGVAICTANCTIFSAYGPADLGCGRCLSGDGHPARTGTPCFPWTEHFVNEHGGNQ